MAAPQPSAQFKAIDVADAFHDRDAEYLASTGPDERAEQKRVREALFRYTDQLWDTAKARARDEHGSDYDTSGDPAYAGIAGMRDLATELVATVNNAIVQAGEELDN